MKTHEEYVNELNKINPTIRVLGTYTKAVNRIQVECITCGKIWEPKAYLLTQGQSCPHCSAKNGARNNKGKTGLKTHDKFLQEMAQAHPNINILTTYINGHTDVACKCSICNHTWSAKPYSLLQGHGCPRCAKSGTSFMEQFIKLSFEKALSTQLVLSRDKSAIGMELDIYLPSIKAAIEPGNWFLHKKSIKRDETKRILCKEKGIRLITIYDKFPNDEPCPFSIDCYTFSEDLNKADRSVLISLITEIFEELNISNNITSKDWIDIETKAYENAKAKTHKDFIQRMNEIHPSITVIGKYQNANKRLLVRCNTCGFEWEGVPASLLSGDGCRKCGTKIAHAKFVKQQDSFVTQVANANPDIEIIGTYTGRHNPVSARCRVCGYTWSPIASSLSRGSNHKGWKTIHKKLGK